MEVYTDWGILTMENYINSSGGNLSEILSLLSIQTNQAPFIGLLIFIFCIIGIGGYMNQVKKYTESNIFMWWAIAGYITTTIAYIMFLMDRLITIDTLLIVFIFSCVGAILFFFTKDN